MSKLWQVLLVAIVAGGMLGMVGCESDSDSGTPAADGNAAAAAGIVGMWNLTEATLSGIPQLPFDPMVLTPDLAAAFGFPFSGAIEFTEGGAFTITASLPNIPGFVTAQSGTISGTYTTAGGNVSLTLTGTTLTGIPLANAIGQLLTLPYNVNGNTLTTSIQGSNIPQAPAEYANMSADLVLTRI